MVADYVRFNRAARAPARRRRRRALAGRLPRRRGLLALVRRAPARAAGRRRVVGRPRADVVASRRASSSQFFAHHGMLSLTGRPQWSTIAGGSARYVEALTAPFADRIRVAHAGRRRDPPPHARRRRGRRRGRRGVRRGRDRRPRRPGARAADRSQRGRGRGPRRLPLPAQRGGAAHRPRAAAAPARRMGGVELSPARRAARPLRRDLLHEPPAGPRRRPAVLRDAEPHGRDRARARHPRHPLRPSRSSRARRWPPRAATRRSAACSARTTAAPTGAGAFTRTAWPARTGRSRACASGCPA